VGNLYRLWDSALDFRQTVLPELRKWLPAGRFVPVEDAATSPALSVLDTVAGVDGWLVSGTAKLQGVASRVQYGDTSWDSFTVRARLRSGAPTELAKRLEALRDRDGHYVVPEFTVQAYVTRPRTGFLSLALLVRTEELYRFIHEHPHALQRRHNPADGAEFVVVWAADLLDAGCTVRRVVRPDVGIQRRDGRWYCVTSPFAEHGADELQWVPEDVFFNEQAKDRACALAAAAQTLQPGLHSREDAFRLAEQFYEWLQHPA
jgi:hypothetical protein